MKNKKNIEEKTEHKLEYDVCTWRDLFVFGIPTTIMLGTLFYCGVTSLTSLNKGDNLIRNLFYQRNSWHYDLNANLPKNTVKFEDFYNKK